MFPGLSSTQLAYVTAVLAFAGGVRGLAGFGSALIATPLLMAVLAPKVVVVALVFPLLVSNATILYSDGVCWSFLRTQGRVLVTLLLGTVVGVVGLVSLSTDLVMLAVSGYLVAYLAFTGYRDAAQRYASRSGVGPLAGAASGLLGGTVGLAGPPLITYLHARDLDRRTFVSAIAVLLGLLGLVRLATMVAADLVGVRELLLGAWFVLPMASGTYLGAWSRPYVPQREFELLVKGLLLVVAVKLAADALAIP